VLSDAKGFLTLPSRVGVSTVDNAEEKKAAALAVLVEALYELEEWDELLTFTQVSSLRLQISPASSASGLTEVILQSFETDFTQPLSALKLLVGFLIDADSNCPHETLSKILRKTLDVLYRRRDVDQLSDHPPLPGGKTLFLSLQLTGTDREWPCGFGPSWSVYFTVASWTKRSSTSRTPRTLSASLGFVALALLVNLDLGPSH
jgi:hypothetical protein